MRNVFIIFLIVITGSFSVPRSALADDAAQENFKEYSVEAAFLYNFVKFTEWPGEQSLAISHTANICIIGDDPFSAALNIFRKASTPKLAFNVIRDITIGAVSKCYILFVSPSEYGNIPAIIAQAQKFPVLTVSEASDFADKGGIIEMAKVQQNIGLFSKDKINLRINIKQAEAQHLHIDAQLLEAAAEVLK